MKTGKNKMNIFRKIFVIFTLFIISLLYWPNSVQAASAIMYLSPDWVSRQVGSGFTISVGMNSGGNAVNAFEATVNIPGNILAITGVGTGGSLCSLWVQQPTISGSSVSFKCGIPSGSTASGNLISISVRGSAVGTSSASITGVRILAGPGQNVTGGATGGSYTITAPPPAATSAPIVTSSTHPNQDVWYKNNSPALSWTRGGGTKGFGYVFDQNAGTVPGQYVSSNSTNITYKDKADGIWYFHIRASGNNGWSYTSHFRVQIDTKAPTNLIIVTEPKVTSDRRPMVSFNAIDATSGIAYYEIKMDKQDFKKISSPYLPPSISSGDHVFTVRAFDKAGNMTEGSVKIKIKEIPVPKITKPKNHDIFKLAQGLTIEGTADPSSVVDLYFDGVYIARGLKVEKDGSWHFNYDKFILPGKHKIFAVAVRDGIESRPSNIINIRIDPAAISLFGIIIPSWLIFVLLLLIIIILIDIIFWLLLVTKKKYNKIREKMIKKNKETQESVKKDFFNIERRLRGDVWTAVDSKESNPMINKMEYDLENRIEKDVETTEQDVEKSIEDEIKDL